MTNIMGALLLYRNRLQLLLLAAGLLFILPFGHMAVRHQQWILFEDLMTIWFCLWIPLAFQLGVMIKRQMVSPMAGLMPGYRAAHIVVAVVIWVFVAVLISLWLSTVPCGVGARVKSAWVFLCLGMYLATIVIAYVSERRTLFFGYGILLFIVGHTRDFVHLLVKSDPAYYALMGLAVCVFGCFLWRLAVLREGMPEFGCVLSWPLHRSKTSAPVRAYIPHPVPLFAQKKGLMRRAFHWAHVEAEDIPGIAWILVLSPFVFAAYIFYWAGPEGFYAHPYANLLVLTVSPLAVMLCFCYRTVSFRDYALLRPLRRQDLAVQWGCFLMVILMAAWIFTSFLFGVLPALVWHMRFLEASKFWAFLLFTGIFTQMTLVCLMYVASLKNQGMAVAIILVYGGYKLLEALGAPYYDLAAIVWHLGLAVGVCACLAAMTYRRWCHEEV
ncbi:MAG: hypothetical protein WCI27_03525 [Candidatus Omnitrophota bacterium]